MHKIGEFGVQGVERVIKINIKIKSTRFEKQDESRPSETEKKVIHYRNRGARWSIKNTNINFVIVQAVRQTCSTQMNTQKPI